MPTRPDPVEEPFMPETNDHPVPAWLTGLLVTLVAWAAYYVFLSVR